MSLVFFECMQSLTNETCSNYSRNDGRWDKENGGGGEFKYDIFDTL
jgi:hypothetical protein